VTLADDFLHLACLSYQDDDPEHWSRAQQLLTEHPELTHGSIQVAAAAADGAAIRQLLEADPAAANEKGGPHGWQPLLYLAYSRQDPEPSLDAVLAAAQLLLDAGADPNASFFWSDLPIPFTVLTGVFGEGELGPVRQPRHPHSVTLARLLLTAGADANDAQTLYNRMFEPGNDHLEVLFEFGLDPTAAMVRDQLQWAISHGMTERVELLVGHGVDVVAPLGADHAAAALAAITGHAELVDYLVAQGSPPPDLNPVDAFIAAALAADRGMLDRLQAEHPGLAIAVRNLRPALVVWAAALGRIPAVELLVQNGFEVNARGRIDIPRDDPWETALHQAAQSGNLELARTLLALGADPEIHDKRFDSTPLGWAHYFNQPEVAQLLAPR
jgi:ankyrin repeat protein